MSVSPRPDSAPDARRAAFEALFREHHAPLCGFAYRFVHSREIAEELVQEVFLYLWEHWDRWETGAPVKTYLFTAVRNAAISYLRHQRVVQRSEPEVVVELFSHSGPSPEADARSAELAAALARAVARLPERCRLVFTLSREQGLTYNQVAEVMGISPKTVEMQMGRAFKALRRYLAPYWP